MQDLWLHQKLKPIEQLNQFLAHYMQMTLEKTGISSVDVVDIVAVDKEPEKVYQPGHPKADKDGYIYMAAVNPEEEMVEMLEASRQYENNVEVVSTLRGLMMRTISMGK